MKRLLMAGLATCLPLIVTYIVVVFSLGIITSPFERLAHYLLSHFHLFDNGFAIFSRDELIHIVSKFFIICTLISLIILVGMLGRWMVFHSLGYFFEAIIGKIPIINRVYGPLKDLVNAIFTPRPEAVRYAVSVPYPSYAQNTIGIATGEYTATLAGNEETYISVFVPTTPNATVGYLCSFLKRDVTYLKISADDALKSVMAFNLNISE